MANYRETWATKIYKRLPTTSGIYAIYFRGSGRAYIGGAKNISRRVKAHLHDMTDRRHRMYADLCEYGPDAIVALVMEDVTDCTNLSEAEGRWMEAYRGGGWELYNSDKRSKLHRDWKVRQ